MRQTLALALFSALGAAVAERCGTGSNCEIVEKDGHKITKFKDGMGPDSDDYVARFGNAEERARRWKRQEDYDTLVTVGKNEIGWACSDDVINVYDVIVSAMNDLCQVSGGCDEGSEHTYESSYVEGESLREANLIFSAEGSYGKYEKSNYVNALAAVSRADTVVTAEMDYVLWGAIAQPTSCTATRFPNYLKVDHFDGNDLLGYMDFNARLEIEDPSGK